MRPTQEQCIATLLGCAIGDTIGMPVEGWKASQIQRYVGRITEPMDPVIIHDGTGARITSDEDGKLKCYTEGLKKGDFTDDTILTLAIAESIAQRRRIDLDDVAKQHIQAYNDHKRPDGSLVGAFGKTTTDAIERLRCGIPPTESGIIGGPGNAPAMKMHAIGIYMAVTGRYGDGMQFAEKVGRMTHLDPRSIASGTLQAHLVYRSLTGITRDEFLDNIVYFTRNEQPIPEEYPLHERGGLRERMRWIVDNRDAPPDDAHFMLKSNSLVFSSYPFALFMVQKYWDSPLEGMLDTVNYGGDCDTTAAIYGALAGARSGIFFPREWLEILQGKERLERAASGIYKLGNYSSTNNPKNQR